MNIFKRIKHWAFFKLVTVIDRWMSDNDQLIMRIVDVNGSLVLVTAKSKLPILYHTSLGNVHYVVTPKGSFVLNQGKLVAAPSKDYSLYRREGLEVGKYVYRFGRVPQDLIKGSNIFALGSPVDHILTHTHTKSSRFISTACAVSGIYHFLGVTASLKRVSFEDFVGSKQDSGARLMKIDTRKVPGCWYNFSDHPDQKIRGYSDADAELTLDGIIPANAIVDVGIINPLKGYIEWEKEGNEYPRLSDRVLDLIYPE